MKTTTMVMYLGIPLLCLVQAVSVYSQTGETGTLRGIVRMVGSRQPILSATVVVVGTNNGAATDMDGVYIIRGIEPGKRKIRVSYIGYDTKNSQIVIQPNTINEMDVTLEETYVKGEEVVVTAQRSGQQAAVNQQIVSNAVENVVAADRLQENPDANVAEEDRTAAGDLSCSIRRGRCFYCRTRIRRQLQPDYAGWYTAADRGYIRDISV